MSERDVWVLFPSADVERCLKCTKNWRNQGYRVAVQVDSFDFFANHDVDKHGIPDLIVVATEYGGYWNAANRLYRAIGNQGDVFVAVGDDMDSDPNLTANEIADLYFDRFPDGNGILQPCGDPQGSKIQGKVNAERICGSPWFGHGWVRADHWGNGHPFPDGFWHFFADELLKYYAESRDLLWMNKELTQYHHHWAFRGGPPPTEYQRRNHHRWDGDKERFEELMKHYGLEK